MKQNRKELIGLTDHGYPALVEPVEVRIRNLQAQIDTLRLNAKQARKVCESKEPIDWHMYGLEAQIMEDEAEELEQELNKLKEME